MAVEFVAQKTLQRARKRYRTGMVVPGVLKGEGDDLVARGLGEWRVTDPESRTENPPRAATSVPSPARTRKRRGRRG